MQDMRHNNHGYTHPEAAGANWGGGGGVGGGMVGLEKSKDGCRNV